MGRRHEQTLLQRRHTNGYQTHKKMFIITSHQGDSNQNHIETQSEWPKLTRQETTSVGEDVEKGEPSYTFGGNASWCSHFGKQCAESTKK